MKKTLWMLPPALVALALVVSNLALPVAVADSAPAAGVQMKSVGALEMGPDGVLFAADSEGAAVWALRLARKASGGSGPPASVEDLDGNRLTFGSPKREGG